MGNLIVKYNSRKADLRSPTDTMVQAVDRIDKAPLDEDAERIAEFFRSLKFTVGTQTDDTLIDSKNDNDLFGDENPLHYSPLANIMGNDSISKVFSYAKPQIQPDIPFSELTQPTITKPSPYTTSFSNETFANPFASMPGRNSLILQTPFVPSRSQQMAGPSGCIPVRDHSNLHIMKQRSPFIRTKSLHPRKLKHIEKRPNEHSETKYKSHPAKSSSGDDSESDKSSYSERLV